MPLQSVSLNRAYPQPFNLLACSVEEGLFVLVETTKKDNVTISRYRDHTEISEEIGKGKWRIRVFKGQLTDKYDDIRCKRVGEIISTKQFLKTIVRDGFSKKDRYFMIYANMRHVKSCSSETTLMKYVDWAAHFIPNGFFKWQDQNKENLRHLRWMVFDFELRRSDGRAFLPQEVYQIFTNEGLEPSMVAPSRTVGNYHVYVAHTEMTGHTKSIYLYEKIQRYYAEKIGTDLGALGAHHPFYLCKKAWSFGLTIHNMDELKERWIKDLRDNSVKEREDSKYVNFKAEQIWKHDAIVALMGCNFNGRRNEAALTLALLFYAMGKTKDEASAFLMGEWYDQARKLGIKPFYPSEVLKAIRQAYSEKFYGPKREYIEALTGIEFPLNIYGYARRVDKRKGKYRKNKNQTINAILEFIRSHGGEVQIFQKDLIAQLVGEGFAERSLKRHLLQLKKNGIITYDDSRGEHAKLPTYKLVQTEIVEIEHETKIEVDTSYRKQNRFLGVKNPLYRAHAVVG
ncbi:hypothetical protein [Paenibacillus cremeus]|uniref:Primase C-terminal 1 domain-containing protein n=1 Tax=Paenibacillus cremeus TaxID=2163881 RepID=A0A559K473_9BACL|nr:hypothetical protein [Paenibacillus cremeus]TVY06921.1 hypothetical protein FPZ49_26770 [Paenibacillus cremeus]